MMSTTPQPTAPRSKMTLGGILAVESGIVPGRWAMWCSRLSPGRCASMKGGPDQHQQHDEDADDAEGDRMLNDQVRSHSKNSLGAAPCAGRRCGDGPVRLGSPARGRGGSYGRGNTQDRVDREQRGVSTITGKVRMKTRPSVGEADKPASSGSPTPATGRAAR